MRSSRLKITGIVIPLLAGVVWVFWPDVDGKAKKKPLNSQYQQVNAKAQTDEEPVREKLLIPDAEGVEKPEGMPDEDWQRLLRVHSIKKSANRNLNFYGKVVDQHGNPVEGVQLEIEILSYQDSFIDYVKTGRERINNELNLTTDANGMFFVEKKKGTSFSIERMVKEGYVASDRGVKYTFIYNNLSSGPDSTMYHSADKSQPVVYELWKQGETEPLIKTFAKLTIEPEKGINEVYYRMAPNGKPSPQPVPGWDIKVTGKNVHSPNSKRQQDDYWEVTLTAGEGGGLTLTDSPHANLAPKTGYQKSLVIKSTDQQNPWDRPVRRAYYSRKDGEEFAAFCLDIDIGSKKTGSRIYVTLADLRINPNGSRNLEFDPSKQIK